MRKQKVRNIRGYDPDRLAQRLLLLEEALDRLREEMHAGAGAFIRLGLARRLPEEADFREFFTGRAKALAQNGGENLPGLAGSDVAEAFSQAAGDLQPLAGVFRRAAGTERAVRFSRQVQEWACRQVKETGLAALPGGEVCGEICAAVFPAGPPAPEASPADSQLSFLERCMRGAIDQFLACAQDRLADRIIAAFYAAREDFSTEEIPA